MNTKVAADAMKLLTEQYAKRKQPDWKALGGLVMKALAKAPSASAAKIAEVALRAYRNGDA